MKISPHREPFFVRLGEHGISGADVSGKHEDIEMSDVIFHPNFKLEKGYFDMALIKLEDPVQFRVRRLFLFPLHFQNILLYYH